MPKSDLTIIARTNFHGHKRLFGIKTDDRRRHMHVIGKTGMGKTSLLLNMAVSDIRNGHGLAFIDPHGDVAEDLLHYIPQERIQDVVYFNPQDLDYPMAFNVLGNVPKHQRHIVADGIIGVFKKIWADSWGPRLEYILRNTILTLLETQDSTLLDIMKVLVDKDYRAEIVYKLEDPMVKSFWLNEFEGYGDKMQAEAVAPIQNKVGQFTSSPLIRNIIGQKQSSFDIREVMDNRKILLMNLSKGAIGEGGAQLLGAMMVTKIQLAAMSRVDIPQEERADFFTYIDEFQNFSTDSFAEILSEARKYRLSLILAHQYLEQLSEEVQAAVFGNVGTTIIFRIGAGDAEIFEKEFAPRLTVEDLVNLPKYRIYLKLMIDGVTSEPFSADTIPDPPTEPISFAEQVIAYSQETYGNPIEEMNGSKDQSSQSSHKSEKQQDKKQTSAKQNSSQKEVSQSKNQNHNQSQSSNQSQKYSNKQQTSTKQSSSQKEAVQPKAQNRNQSQSSHKSEKQQDKKQTSAKQTDHSSRQSPSQQEKKQTITHSPDRFRFIPTEFKEHTSVVFSEIESKEKVQSKEENVDTQTPSSHELAQSHQEPDVHQDLQNNSSEEGENEVHERTEVALHHHEESRTSEDDMYNSEESQTSEDLSQQVKEDPREPESQQNTPEDVSINQPIAEEPISESLDEATVINPILSKKLKEWYTRNESMLGEVEYRIKAKIRKHMHETESQDRVPLYDFVYEIIEELQEKIVRISSPEDFEDDKKKKK